MKHEITGLHVADRCAVDQIPDGVFLVRVQRARFQRKAQKPYYTLTLDILEPSRFGGQVISSRLYCSPKALWKLNWFLRDFGYDTELLEQDEVDETQLVGLKGVVKISRIVFNGSSLLRLEGFASADRRSNLPDRLLRRMISSPISMPSANWTGHAAYSSGKPVRADTQRNLKDCWPWIRNLSAIRG